MNTSHMPLGLIDFIISYLGLIDSYWQYTMFKWELFSNIYVSAL